MNTKRKQTIRLNESQLKQIIKESVRKVLTESIDIQTQNDSLANDENNDIKYLCKKLISSNRIYRWSDNGLGVDKIFNHGMGSLIFVNFIPEEKVILVNKSVCRKTDIQRIESLFPEWEIEFVELGYPDYYFKSSLLSVRNK